MIRADRRSVLKGGVTLATLGAGLGVGLGAAPAAFAFAREAPALFVYDARFDASRHLAAQWEAQGVPVLDPRDHDLGLAWRGHIPRLLGAGRRIEGATLWSDRFICECMGRAHGLNPDPLDIALPGPAGAGLRQWRLA